MIRELQRSLQRLVFKNKMKLLHVMEKAEYKMIRLKEGRAGLGRYLDKRLHSGADFMEITPTSHPKAAQLLADVETMSAELKIVPPKLFATTERHVMRGSTMAAGYEAINMDFGAFDKYPQEQLKGIVAHEVGHVKRGDIFREVAFFPWNRSPSRYRQAERAADKICAKVGGAAGAEQYFRDIRKASTQEAAKEEGLFSEAMRTRRRRNALEDPNSLHPPINERIRFFKRNKRTDAKFAEQIAQERTDVINKLGR